MASFNTPKTSVSGANSLCLMFLIILAYLLLVYLKRFWSDAVINELDNMGNIAKSYNLMDKSIH